MSWQIVSDDRQGGGRGGDGGYDGGGGVQHPRHWGRVGVQQLLPRLRKVGHVVHLLLHDVVVVVVVRLPLLLQRLHHLLLPEDILSWKQSCKN